MDCFLAAPLRIFILKVALNGAIDRNRTGDLIITNDSLYQLSYDGGYWSIEKEFRMICQTPLIPWLCENYKIRYTKNLGFLLITIFI